MDKYGTYFTILFISASNISAKKKILIFVLFQQLCDLRKIFLAIQYKSSHLETGHNPA